jgi:hypothetical protein
MSASTQRQRREVDSPDHYGQIPGQYRFRTMSSPPVVNGNRGKILKLPQYNGKTCLKTFLIKFDKYRQFYGLSDKVALAHLEQSLTDCAAESLWSIDPDSSLSDLYTCIASSLWTGRIGRSLPPNIMKQARNENLESVYLDILRLGQMAYPGQKGDLFHKILKDSYSYINALYNVALRQRLFELNPPNIYEAHSQALRPKALYENSKSEKGM